MNLVLYQDGKALAIYRGINQPQISDKNIKWENGELTGISVPVLLLDESISLKEGDAVTDDHIAQDKKNQFQKHDLIKENAALKMQVADLAFELMMKGVL